jgi:hypothetical protein
MTVSALAVLRHHRSAAPLRWVLATMALSFGLSMMFGARPAGADDAGAAPVQAPAAAATAAESGRSTPAQPSATRDDRGR